MITADQLVAHAVGDYILQSDWMANEKTKKSVAALAHALCYSLPFLIFRPSIVAFMVIAGTHFVIDRWRLARFVVYVKNFIGPNVTRTRHYHEVATTAGGGVPHFVERITVNQWWQPWAKCSATGYFSERPPWMSVWLLIIADNTLHVLCNALALRYL